jgi:hypothetical protein
MTMERFPTQIRERDRHTQVNWVAILTFAGSLLYSLTIWIGVFRAVEHLVG